MTLEEACRLIDPATDLDALAEIEYYNGFKGKDAAAKALHEASQMVVDFVRQMSWHDAKNPPIAHEESWECAGEKHCAVISDIVWVCCESGHTMKGWVENGTWHIEDQTAAGTALPQVWPCGRGVAARPEEVLSLCTPFYHLSAAPAVYPEP